MAGSTCLAGAHKKKKMASSHTRHFKALTMHARKTRTAPPHRTFPPLFLAFRNALRSHALTRLRARTTNTHTTTHTCTLLCLFSREQATSLHVCRQCRTACFCTLINSSPFWPPKTCMRTREQRARRSLRPMGHKLVTRAFVQKRHVCRFAIFGLRACPPHLPHAKFEVF